MASGDRRGGADGGSSLSERVITVSIVFRVWGKGMDRGWASLGLQREMLDQVWVEGEARVRGGTHTHSGFSLLVAEGEKIAAVKKTTRFMDRFGEGISALVRQGGNAEIDFGVFLNAAEVAASVSLGADLLRIFTDAGVGVTLSSYVCSD